MTPLEDAYMLEESCKLSFAVVRDIFDHGFSRVPVYASAGTPVLRRGRVDGPQHCVRHGARLQQAREGLVDVLVEAWPNPMIRISLRRAADVAAAAAAADGRRRRLCPGRRRGGRRGGCGCC